MIDSLNKVILNWKHSKISRAGLKSTILNISEKLNKEKYLLCLSYKNPLTINQIVPEKYL